MATREKQFFYYALAVGAGVGSTQQMATNTRLAAYMGAAVISAFANFLFGLLTITLVHFLQVFVRSWGQHRRRESSNSTSAGSAVCEARKQPTVLSAAGSNMSERPSRRVYLPYFAGCFGAVYVAGTIYGAIGIGIALGFAVAVTGQILSASLIDHTGFLATPVRRMTRQRAVGVVLACAGCCLSVAERVKDGDVGMVLGFCLLIFVCGLILPIQTCLGRQLAVLRCGGSSVLSTVWSFIVGGLCLGAASGVYSAVALTTTSATLWDVGNAPGWTFTGGIFGAIYVYLCFVLAPKIGMARMYTCVVFGQLVSSLLYDNYGVLGVPVNEATPLRIAGVCMVLAAAIVSGLDREQPPQQPSSSPMSPVARDRADSGRGSTAVSDDGASHCATTSKRIALDYQSTYV